MSCYTLMGRPAAILETMALIIHSYVLVLNVGKRRWISPYGCNFLIYMIRRPCYLYKYITRNQTLFNVWLHVQTLIIVGILSNYLVPYNKYHSTYRYEIRPTDTVVPVGSSHIHCFNPIKLYLLIRYNRIINKIWLFPNSPKYPGLDYNFSK